MFVIAVTLLVVISAVHLLHQYWTREFAPDEAPKPDAQPQPIEAPGRTLRAA